MITLTRLNYEPIVINAELIEKMEATPEVVLTLTTGRRVMVRQTLQEVVDAVCRYRRHSGASLPARHAALDKAA